MNFIRRIPQPKELTLLLDPAPGRWIEEAFGSRFAHVEALVPKGYETYARLFHPALTQRDRRVPWSTVAEWSGKTYHSLMSFEGISVPKSGHGSSDRSWCVSTDIDLESTYIGASEDCIERLLCHTSLEVLRTTSDAPVYMQADTINL